MNDCLFNRSLPSNDVHQSESMDITIEYSPSPPTLTAVPFPTPNMDVASILNPAIPQVRRRPCNLAYTLEQIHFIQYCKEDLNLSWRDIEVSYNETFLDPARLASVVGLQCRYYRAQRYPVFDISGKLVRNDDGKILMHDITVRKRGQKNGLVVPILDTTQRPMYNENGLLLMRELSENELHGPEGCNLDMKYQKYIKLVDRVPQHAAEYEWVTNEHKALARRNAAHDQERGFELPGAVLPGGVEVRTITLRGSNYSS